MIKSIDFPDKVFATKEELFKALRENIDKIIACKTAETYKSYSKGSASGTGFLLKTDDVECKTGPQMKEGYVYPVINTTLYLDSHNDVHLNGIWDRSVKEQAGKLYYVCDHEIKTNTIIAWPENVNAMVKTVPWSWIGKDFSGNTQALIYEINKSNLVNDAARKIIEDKRPVQNSVRMQYVKIQLGMNSEAKEDIHYKAFYDLHIDSIANKDVAEAQGYFFGVEEAKIIKEGSMVPLGSNDATPIRQKDEAGTTASEHKDEPIIPITQEKQFLFNANLY